MTQPIVYVDVSRIREGKLADLEEAMEALSRFVEANMPRVLSRGFFLDEQRTTMTVVAIHPDSASLELHMDEGNEEFRKFAVSSSCRGSRSMETRARACATVCIVRRRCSAAAAAPSTSRTPASLAETRHRQAVSGRWAGSQPRAASTRKPSAWM